MPLAAAGGLKGTEAKAAKGTNVTKNFAAFVDSGDSKDFAPFADKPAAGIWQGIGTGKERNKENKKSARALKPSALKPSTKKV